MNSIIIKSTDEFNTKVINSSTPVIVDFFADWCGPCRMLAPVIEELANEAEGYSVYKVNVDEMPEIAEKYDISSIPTLIGFKNVNVVNRHTGLMPKDNIPGLIGL